MSDLVSFNTSTSYFYLNTVFFFSASMICMPLSSVADGFKGQEGAQPCFNSSGCLTLSFWFMLNHVFHHSSSAPLWSFHVSTTLSWETRVFQVMWYFKYILYHRIHTFFGAWRQQKLWEHYIGWWMWPTLEVSEKETDKVVPFTWTLFSCSRWKQSP